MNFYLHCQMTSVNKKKKNNFEQKSSRKYELK